MTERVLSVVTVCGRVFTEQDLEVIRRIISDPSQPWRAEIARRVCRELGWVRLDGQLKTMSCRVALGRLERRGLIQLPPARVVVARNGGCSRTTGDLVAGEEVACEVSALSGLVVRAVQTRKDSRYWKEVVSRFHYLGYTPLPGAQQRYLVESEQGLLGAIGFGASAWKVAARDAWIGWTAERRQAGLHLVVNNARFVLLPWVHVRNLASRVLAMSARRIREDWAQRYGYKPVLLETFVEQTRFRGVCYRAANWIYVGDTKGRGKLDRHWEQKLPVKRVFVYPLTRSWREELSE